jgi:tritrans,polycis-undecaprenyl-diphosphate synthase [geranylgeranyl-diphosphate specific]
MKEPWKGHELGAERLEKLFEWCREIGVKEVTLYAFSIQNFNRPKKEFDYLMKIFNDEFDDLLKDEKLHKHNVKIRVIGRIEKFPKDLYEKMKRVMEVTKDYGDYIINFAMAYGGREEIIDATKKVAEKIKSGELDVNGIDEDSFSNELYMSGCPDLIIRTGGDQRTSNFLLWQSTYSEWFFLEKMWPEFEKGDLINVINKFNDRERRFGR